jgi:hypothetical protein
MRVELPSYTDRWMMGDRYGTVVNVTQSKLKAIGATHSIASVLLDKSGKTVRVILEDCKEI